MYWTFSVKDIKNNSLGQIPETFLGKKNVKKLQESSYKEFPLGCRRVKSQTERCNILRRFTGDFFKKKIKCMKIILQYTRLYIIIK